MDNLYNDYDVVRITKPFTLQVNDLEQLFPANVEGVIVRSFDKEYLIEFTYTDDETYYALIKENDLQRIWKYTD